MEAGIERPPILKGISINDNKRNAMILRRHPNLRDVIRTLD